MKYKDIINNLKPYDYSKYSDITSNEKLMVFAAKKLSDRKVPLTLNYLCIATFKIFPDTFCCDEEFKEFPSIDRLNRTYMHLKYVKKGKPYIAGTASNGYVLTSYGIAVAEEVESIINNSKMDKEKKAPIVDAHKKGFARDYLRFIETDGYKRSIISSNELNIMFVWNFYDVIPYTQIKYVKEGLENIKHYAKELNDEKCIEIINKIEKII